MGSEQHLKRARGKTNAGKVESLLDAKLKGVEWGEFRIGDLFEIGTGSLLSTDLLKDGVIPRISAKSENNGILGSFDTQKLSEARHFNNFISVNFFGSDGGIFYHPYTASVEMKVHTLKMLNKEFNLMTGVFIANALNVVLGGFGYGNQLSSSKLKKLDFKISLPTKNNEIDFEFMENFIAELETKKIERLEAYLVENGLKEYGLSQEEEEVLRDFESGKLSFKEFTVKELFEINTYKKRFDANKITLLENGKPYVARGSSNNGVKGYIIEDEQFLNDGNTISFGQDTATMFYQEKPYFTGDKIKILKSKVDLFNKLNGLFLVTTMTKSFSSFSWGGSSFNIEIIGNQLMKLPTKNNQPDYALMYTLISAVQKLVVKDVVLYVQRKGS